ncbi:MAG: GGDEF domain-containing protein [Caloramator sp.]|nr:GGDEF domain-containing protein [Caloramator sp.]
MLNQLLFESALYKEIYKLEEMIIDSIEKKKNVLLNGKRGYGKTFILNRVLEGLKNKKECVIYLNSKEEKLYLSFIHQLLNSYKLNKNYTIFNKEILELLSTKANENNKEEIYSSFYYIKHIIKDITIYSKLTIIVDDIQDQDEYFWDLISFLLKDRVNDEFNFIIGYSEHLNNNFISFIEKIKKNDFVEFNLKKINTKFLIDIYMKLFNCNDENKVKNILEITDGNPLLVLQYLNYEKNNKEKVYFNELWPIKTFNELEAEEKNLIKFICFFKNGVNLNILSELTGYSITKIGEMINRLYLSGLISYSITDEGLIYNVPYLLLKNFVLEQLDAEYKSSTRIKIVNLLNTNQTYFLVFNDEVLFQTNQINNINLKLEYLNKLEDFYLKEKKWNALIEIKYELINLTSYDEGLKIYESITEIYELIGETNKALDIYNALLINYKNNIDKKIETIVRKAKLFVRTNNIEDFKKTFNEIKEYKLDDIKDKKILDSLEMLNIYNALFDGDLETAEHLCDKLLIDEEVGLILKGEAHQILAVINKFSGNSKESIKNFLKAYKLFTKCGYVRGIVHSLNNCGTIWIDDFEEFVKGFKYLNRALEIARRNNVISLEIMPICNMASSLFYQFKFDECKKYCIEAIRYINRVNNVAIKNLLLGCISFIELWNGNIKKAIKYIEEQKKLINKVHSSYVWSYNLSMALFNYLINNETEFNIYINNIRTNKDKLPINQEIDLFANIYNPEYYINNIEKFNPDIRKDLCLLLCEKGLNNYAKRVYEGIELDRENNIDSIAKNEIIRYFLGYSLDLDKIELIISKIKNKHILWKLYYIKSILNNNLNYKFSSINDIMQAANIINNIFYGLDFSYKENYLERYGIYLEEIKKINLLEYFNSVLYEDNKQNDISIDTVNKHWINENKSRGNLIYENVMQVIKDFSSDCFNNLELIINYIKVMTISEEVYIVDKLNKFIVSTNKKLEYKGSIKNLKEGIFESYNYNINKNIKTMVLEIKNKQTVEAFLIVKSDKYYNNINTDSLNQCKMLNNLLLYNIHQLNLSQNFYIDKLTGAYNRKYMDKIFEELDKYKNYSIAMFDMDNFKYINDKYGHLVGDKVLQEFSKTILAIKKRDFILFRYGGEEFLLFMPDTSKEESVAFCEEVRKRIENIKIEGLECKLTVSGGLYFCENVKEDINLSINKADEALYISKNTGKNKCTVWDSENNIQENSVNFISTGNVFKDINYLNYLNGMSKLINIVKMDLNKEQKVELYKNKIREIVEASFVNIFEVSNKLNQDNLFQYTLSKMIEDKSLKVFIETIKQNNSFITKENILIPIIKNENVEYVLHIVFDNKNLSLTKQDYNMLSTIAQIYLLMV